MKTDILDITGKKAKSIELPAQFSGRIREDILLRILENKKTKQPYSPSPVAGKQHSASGKVVHRRHVWRSGYGRGISRIPRKIMSRSGSQFNWIGAEVSSTVGGRRAHPPKVISMINSKKINKKELRLAFESALSATASPKMISEKYNTLRDMKEIAAPFVVESKILSLKTKDFISSLRKILGERIFEVAMKVKKVRSGQGKKRGRKYKSNAGMLFVLGNRESLKSNVVDFKTVENLGVTDLAKGGPGRITMYTEKAIKDLEEKIGGKKK